MSDNPSPPMFSERTRLELAEQRVLVLDGPLTDDNGMLLASQIVSLAAADPSTDIFIQMRCLKTLQQSAQATSRIR